MRRLVDRLFPWLEGHPAYPLFVLLALNAVDEFDRLAFFTLAPEIRKSFGLSLTEFGLISGMTTVLVLLSGFPIGFVGDRMRRTRLVIVAAAMWTTMSVGTGLAPFLWVLIITRFGSGIGRVANEAIHTSLLTDYYPQHLQGRVFALHRSGNPIGLTLGPILAGAIAAATGNWRWAFFLVATPTLVIVVLALRLREPSRGEADDAELAAEAAKEKPIPMARGFHALMAIPTLKRFYISAFFGGGVIFALTAFLAQFFDEIFGVREVGRGMIGSGQGIAQLIGTAVGGFLADRLRRHSLGRMAFVSGLAIGLLGAGVLITGVAPILPVAIAGSWISYFAIGLWTAPAISVLAVVLPARLRSLGVGMIVMFFGAGGFVFTVLAGAIADSPAGLRGAISTLAPVLFLAAAIYLSAARFVNDDGQKALEALALEVGLRHERMTVGAKALLVARGLDVSYEGVRVLFGVDFDIAEGEMVALLGTNGAGKSTLLKTISGVLHPDRGSIFLDSENITYHEPHETAAAGIIQVPGGRGIFPSLSVKEGIELAGWMYHSDPEYVKSATDDALKLFPILKERWEHLAGDLSGGEQQMLTLAQAFIAKPRLLMIDELSLGLAPIVVEQLIDAVRAIHANGTTVVLVEQSVNLALTIADRAFFMEKGQMRFTGPAKELFGRRDLIRSVFLEGAGRATGNSFPKVEALGSPRSSRKEGEAGGSTMLEVKEVGVGFGGIKALDGVTMRVEEGSIVGIIGPNGAGKTTLFDLISGFIRPDEGRIIFCGQDITHLSPEARARLGLGRSFQDARLFPSMTVTENIALALERHVEVRDPIAAAFSLPAVWLSEMQVDLKVDELIQRLGLDAYSNKFVHELSTGTRRIVDIACSLAHGPKLLLLDEPSSGIAQAETESLGPLLARLRDDFGYTMMIIEHDIPLVSSIADELVALDVGRLITRGAPPDVVKDPIVVNAYLGSREEVVVP